MISKCDTYWKCHTLRKLCHSSLNQPELDFQSGKIGAHDSTIPLYFIYPQSPCASTLLKVNIVSKTIKVYQIVALNTITLFPAEVQSERDPQLSFVPLS